ncbi:hypothetical protein BD309DRAFT_967362 [Dichomitus squalens]|nr:hypothetical protein BD309DRAFT_967362 [Dichomitus squalens]
MDVIRPLLPLHAIYDLSVIFPAYFNLSCATSYHLLMAEAWSELEAHHMDIRPYIIKHESRPHGGSRPRDRSLRPQLPAASYTPPSCDRDHE